MQHSCNVLIFREKTKLCFTILNPVLFRLWVLRFKAKVLQDTFLQHFFISPSALGSTPACFSIP